MYDCATDIVSFHNEKITLPSAEQTNMRERRNANRDRLKRGLKEDKEPAPREFHSQGSYAMKTMVQHPEKDYDIDDGVYFNKEDLIGPRGAEMTSLQVRQMLRDALDDGSFKTAPAVRKNCVRVYYEAGYHVDMPAYRRVLTEDVFGNQYHHYELASSEWKRSDARDVSKWFNEENKTQSPDKANGRQLRRIVRIIKKFARSRDSWADQILSGFGITALVSECFYSDIEREDRSLYYTMVGIRDRLVWDLEIDHPVTPDETITNGPDDARARFLRERLTEAIENLAPLFDLGCSRKEAVKCWDKVFATDFFSDRSEATPKGRRSLLKTASVAPTADAFSFPNVPRADDKPRGFG